MRDLTIPGFSAIITTNVHIIPMNNFDSINPNREQKPPRVVISPVPDKPQKVNLLTAKQKTSHKKILKKILIAIALIIVILGGVVVIRAANLSQKIFVGQTTT